MKHVYTHDNIVVLHAVKNVLSLHDIESFIKNEHSVPVGAQHGINNIFHELWIVNDADQAQASRIIKDEFESVGAREEWICSRCHEHNDGSFEICWKCQASNDQS
ncbi:MAG: DUF2007 domain-containing protein [Gammaproteobacteria bacterium]|nr:DUF2007 domain-containing protein [Gammaproteobacteria bacterium]